MTSDLNDFDEDKCAEKQSNITQQYMEDNLTDLLGGLGNEMAAQRGADMKRIEAAQALMQELVQGVSDHVNSVESRVQDLESFGCHAGVRCGERPPHDLPGRCPV